MIGSRISWILNKKLWMSRNVTILISCQLLKMFQCSRNTQNGPVSSSQTTTKSIPKKNQKDLCPPGFTRCFTTHGLISLNKFVHGFVNPVAWRHASWQSLDFETYMTLRPHVGCKRFLSVSTLKCQGTEWISEKRRPNGSGVAVWQSNDFAHHGGKRSYGCWIVVIFTIHKRI